MNSEITLKDLFELFVRRIKWIAIITAVAVIMSIFITLVLITPKYTATTSLLVSSFVSKNNLDITYNELVASQNLVPTYIEVLKSNSVLSQVSKELDEKYSVNALSSMINAAGVGETQVIKVSVETTDPQVSMDIANAVATAAPAVIVEKAKVGAVEVIDYAVLPTSQSSPNLMVNIVIGFMLGLILSYLGFFIYETFDTIIREEEDITKAFDIPLLGTVPPLDDISSSSSLGGEAK